LTATAQRRAGIQHLDVLDRVLQVARSDDYQGYSKHDGLNSPLLARVGGESRLRRLGAIQVVTRSPVDIRPLVGVRKARNAKGLSLFARALLARHRITSDGGKTVLSRGDDPPIPPAPPDGGKTESASATLIASLSRLMRRRRARLPPRPLSVNEHLLLS
jgi:hypothetical protein